MPPSAPELDRWAGTSTSSAGSASKRVNDFSSVSPAPALTHPATSNTGTDSCTMRRRPSVDDRQPATTQTSAAATSSRPTDGVTTEIPSRNVAR
jgi:hypothetical protein